jgi:hypothetical protein
MTPTFNSGKRMSLGTNHERMGGQSLVVRLNILARTPSTVCSGLATRIVSVPFSFFANPFELSLKTGKVLVGKFLQIDEFISSVFQRAN